MQHCISYIREKTKKRNIIGLITYYSLFILHYSNYLFVFPVYLKNF